MAAAEAKTPPLQEPHRPRRPHDAPEMGSAEVSWAVPAPNWTFRDGRPRSWPRFEKCPSKDAALQVCTLAAVSSTAPPAPKYDRPKLVPHQVHTAPQIMTSCAATVPGRILDNKVRASSRRGELAQTCCFHVAIQDRKSACCITMVCRHDALPTPAEQSRANV